MKAPGPSRAGAFTPLMLPAMPRMQGATGRAGSHSARRWSSSSGQHTEKERLDGREHRANRSPANLVPHPLGRIFGPELKSLRETSGRRFAALNGPFGLLPVVLECRAHILRTNLLHVAERLAAHQLL
jgi:hypothetical protein